VQHAASRVSQNLETRAGEATAAIVTIILMRRAAAQAFLLYGLFPFRQEGERRERDRSVRLRAAAQAPGGQSRNCPWRD
jgi:hypothetical protein